MKKQGEGDEMEKKWGRGGLVDEAEIEREGEGIIWFVVIMVEKDMGVWIGGCVALFQFAWADHFGGLGWCHKSVKVA